MVPDNGGRLSNPHAFPNVPRWNIWKPVTGMFSNTSLRHPKLFSRLSAVNIYFLYEMKFLCLHSEALNEQDYEFCNNKRLLEVFFLLKTRKEKKKNSARRWPDAAGIRDGSPGHIHLNEAGRLRTKVFFIPLFFSSLQSGVINESKPSLRSF